MGKLVDLDDLEKTMCRLNEQGHDIREVDCVLIKNVLKEMPEIDAVPREQINKAIQDIKHSDIHGIARPGYIDGFADGLRASIRNIDKYCGEVEVR